MTGLGGYWSPQIRLGVPGRALAALPSVLKASSNPMSSPAFTPGRWSATRTPQPGGVNSIAEGGFVGVYGRTESGDILVDMDLGVAYNRYDRQSHLWAAGTIARGDYDGWLFGTGLGVGRRFDLGPGQSFSPFIRARYSGSYDDSFTESGVANPVTTDGVFSHLIEGRLEGIYRHDLVLENGPGHVALTLGGLVRHALRQ